MRQTLTEALAVFNPRLPLAIALSGGADSTALLLACAEKWPGAVRAIHIHHGLQAAADAFEAHCVALCRRLNVPLAVRRVNAQPARGESPEDAARKARYEAFSAIPGTEWPQLAIKDIAIAQHADDQVETILLALSRGGGLPGLAAMPAQWRRGGLTYHRPLLAVSGPALRQWLRARGEPWIDDPSNTDERFTRNRIRARLLPALEAAFPQFRDTFARSASHAAQAQALLSEVAAEDLAGAGVLPVIARLQGLSRPRQANLLRHWLRQVHKTTPTAAQLAELLDQIADCTTRGHRLRLKVGAGFVVRIGDALDWQPAGGRPEVS
jgi:tRNA(Ile)-lysidine synthase